HLVHQRCPDGIVESISILDGERQERCRQIGDCHSGGMGAPSDPETCPDQFVPEPPDIKKGIERYIERKVELGEEFTSELVFPSWDPGSRDARRRWLIERAEQEDRKRGRLK